MVTFDANRILLNWAGLSCRSGNAVKINFAFSRVPEPGTLALPGLGLLGLFARHGSGEATAALAVIGVAGGATGMRPTHQNSPPPSSSSVVRIANSRPLMRW